MPGVAIQAAVPRSRLNAVGALALLAAAAASWAASSLTPGAWPVMLVGLVLLVPVVRWATSEGRTDKTAMLKVGLLGILVALAGAVSAVAQEPRVRWDRLKKGTPAEPSAGAPFRGPHVRWYKWKKGTPAVRESPHRRVVGRPFLIGFRNKRPRPGETVTLRFLPGTPLPGSAMAGDPSGRQSPGMLRLVRGPATQVVPRTPDPEDYEILTWKVVALKPGVYPYEQRTSTGFATIVFVTVVKPEPAEPERPAPSRNPPRPPRRPAPDQVEPAPQGDGPEPPAPSHNRPRPPRRPTPGRPQLPRGGHLPEGIPAAPGGASGDAAGDGQGGFAR
jgi:hypothetical protein